MDSGRITAMIHTSAAKTMTIAQSPSASATVSQSPWHSPVPYLFGGLAAMLGLIAFALLILACSYWRLSGYLEGGERDLEAGEEAGNGGEDGQMKKTAKPVFEEKFLVIMAGQQKPTCLATPMSSRASSFGSTSTTSSSSGTSADSVVTVSTGAGAGAGSGMSADSAVSVSTSAVSVSSTGADTDGEKNNEEESASMGSSTNQTNGAHQVS